MKKAQIVMAILVATLMICQGAAYAQLVNGKVVSADPAAKSLTISRTNAETGASEDVVIWTNEQTAFSGTASLEELKAGDEVWVDAEEDAATKNWIATSIQLLQAQAEAPATPEIAATTQ